jgi:hypothetical protein
MLHELLSSNREELIRRCRTKAAKRFAPGAIPAGLDHGVPLFLQQLIDTLQQEQQTNIRLIAEPEAAPASSAIGRSAALHGANMLGQGYSVDQVVHDYGDVCQAATELAIEQETVIGTDEFRTLNRCLDDAIADAVAAYGGARQSIVNGETQAMHERLQAFAGEQRRLLDIAVQSFSAIKTGNIGVTGATGALLLHALFELRSLTTRALAEIGIESRDNAAADKQRSSHSAA